ncbi:MAG: hypothetical protein K6A65_06635 [Succinivibrionaceae bacterium]|nr:hypothetical protein [Succinivibrionaceae bacterium]
MGNGKPRGMWARAAALLATAVAALALSGCDPYPEDYLGTWVGLDERRSTTVMYTYRIVQKNGGSNYSVRITQSYYALDNGMMLVWKSSKPRYFSAVYDSSSDGCLKGSFGLLCYDIHTAQMKAGTMLMVKRAKNTVMKLKAVALESAKEIYPNIPVVD